MNPKNAFYVLELAPEATVSEVERQGQKLLGLLSVGAERARSYVCPLGRFSRDETLVRDSVARLRDPALRAREACLAGLLQTAPSETARSKAPEPDEPLADAFELAGYRGL